MPVHVQRACVRVRASISLLAALAVLAACNTTAPMELDRPNPDTPSAIEAREDADEIAQAAMFGESKYKPIAFTSAISAIRHGTVVMHFPAGGVEGLGGTLCNYRHQGESVYEWRATGKFLGNWDGEVGTMIHEALAQRGFDLAGDPEAMFEVDDDRNRAQYLLGARLTEMVGNGCEEHHWWDGRPLGKYSAEIQIAVDWILYDPLRKEPVETFTSKGYGIQKRPKRTGITDAFFDAWGAATEKLAVDPDFAALLSTSENETFRSQPLADEPILIEANRLRNLPIRETLDAVLDSTVSIRTGTGLGSGFLISRDGYILTNHHVTGNAVQVVVVLRNGIEVTGTVLRRHKQRDVALIKVPLSGGDPFPIRTAEPEVTEDVYAVGNPLEEALRSTVTRGVVSATRRSEQTGLRLIQADVDIQSGNSGGPLLDTNGNVVAVAVSGYGPGGFSVGANFFIPIAAALRFLNIRIAKEGNAAL